MDFEQCLRGSRRILMEGALGERLKGAYGLTPDPDIALQALEQPFNQTERVRARFWGIQANASPLPYDQLDGAANPRNAPPGQLAEAMIRLRDAAGLRILGGCCGTDGTYMEAIARRM